MQTDTRVVWMTETSRKVGNKNNEKGELLSDCKNAKKDVIGRWKMKNV